MATIFIDGSVCLNREGACYKYYSAISTHFAQWGQQVIFTPGPEGVLENLAGPGIQVLTRSTPKAPSWLPQGAWRKHLSKLRQGIENSILRSKSARAPSHSPTAPSPSQVFFSFYYNLPADPKMPSVCIVLDLIDEIFPELDSEQNRTLKAKRLASMERAQKIICISETTRRDLIQLYPRFATKSETIPIGIELDYFGKHSETTQAASLLQTMGLRRPYILHVGGRLNHKNFPLLARAFKEGGFGSQFDLVCTGEKFSPEELQMIEQLKLAPDIKHIRFPDEFTLRVLYQNAALFAYPSRYEGFGIPPLEAMASGCPVVAAKGGSIPEVSGPGAWLVSPDDSEEFAQAMHAMLRPDIAAQFRAKGRAHVKNFEWTPTARKILDLFLTAAGEKKTNPLSLSSPRAQHSVG